MQNMTATELFDFFQTHHVCDSLTRDEVSRMTHYFEEKNCVKDEVISDMGEIGHSMYLVLEGRVEFIGFDGKQEIVVGSQKPGHFIGEISFFDRKPRMLKMASRSKELRLLEITRPMYERLRLEQPYIAVNLVENVIVNLDGLVRKISTDLSHLEHYMTGYGRH